MILLPRALATSRNLRHFFSWPGIEKLVSSTSELRPVTFHERKILPYTRQQAFDVISDVASYKDFLPYCPSSRILKRRETSQNVTHMEAELSIGYSSFKVSYISLVTLRPYEAIEARAAPSDTTFSHLQTVWRFQEASDTSSHPLHVLPTPDNPPRAQKALTLVSLDLSYALKNPVQRAVMDSVFSSVCKLTIDSFESRCKKKYGPGIL